MKINFLTFFLLFSVFGFSQDTIKMSLNDFDRLKVFHHLNVELYRSDKNEISITGNNANQLKVNIKKGELRLSMQIKSILKKNKPKIKLYCNTNLSEIDANEGATIKIMNPLKQNQIYINAQEGASVDAILHVNYLKVKGLSGANLIIKGTSKAAEISCSSAAYCNATHFNVNQLIAYAKSGSKISATGYNSVDLEASLGGQIKLYGNPKSKKIKSILGGKVIETTKKN